MNCHAKRVECVQLALWLTPILCTAQALWRDVESSDRSAMFIAAHATRSSKLRRSGMNSIRSHMPLLRSLARRLGAELTIDMALLPIAGVKN